MGDLLEVADLRKKFVLRESLFVRRDLWAVSGVTFSVARGETLGLVGESGCGKSTVGRCIVRLIDTTAGAISFDGHRISRFSQRQFWPLRRRIQMVFQDPSDSLNPRMTVQEMVMEPLRLHTRLSRRDREDRVRELLELVGLKDEYMDRFPHQLSTGQQQRVGVARAVATQPDFLVLDEPTSALDVSVRGRILKLLSDLGARFGMTYLFISHDLSVIKHMCQRVAVMYLGMVVEVGPAAAIFREPLHPYTTALIAAIPIPDPKLAKKRMILSGEVPSPVNLPAGCFFRSRCPRAQATCAETRPGLRDVGDGHRVACLAV
jgi:oligopeptide/dipeptide ABC transporter ATP-binding protein